MRSIQVITENGKVKILVDGVQLTGVHSFSLDYIKGAPLLFSCVADVEKDDTAVKVLH